MISAALTPYSDEPDVELDEAAGEHGSMMREVDLDR